MTRMPITPSWLWRASRRIVTHNHHHKDARVKAFSYSDEDVATLQEIAELPEQGVNAVGIRYLLQKQITYTHGERGRRETVEQ
jgi:hypothetical protein